MPKPRPLRSKSPADVHFEGQKSDRRQRMRSLPASGITSPTEISGLFAWADYSDVTKLFQDTGRTTAIDTDGQEILGITDGSVGEAHFTGGTTGPTYKVNIQNGKSVGRFPDPSLMTIASAVTAKTAWTVFIVAKVTTLDTTSRTLCSFITADNNSQFLTDSDNGDATQWNFYNGAFNDVGGTATDWNVIVIRINSASSMDFYISGGTATNVNPADSITTSTIHLNHGAQGGGGNQFLGDCGEIGAYSSALSLADINRLGTFLGTKWGITWTTAT